MIWKSPIEMNIFIPYVRDSMWPLKNKLYTHETYTIRFN